MQLVHKNFYNIIIAFIVILLMAGMAGRLEKSDIALKNSYFFLHDCILEEILQEIRLSI